MAKFKQFKLTSSSTGNNYIIRISGEVPKKDLYFVLPFDQGSWICTLRFDRANNCFNTNFEGNLFLSLADETICIMGAPANDDNTGEAYVGEPMTAWTSLIELGQAIEI
jgi:hypothetical protein